ncbi:cell division protein FtsL [Ideonella sp. A 288]|uniref:cell division protein FtsL n=1 Tax=Ideonella sp. A 288 TaxID=1962181 RepID=UPI000B4B5E9B|nr:cell division protein FtsL [Ideonella sp. A 288]
MNRVNLLLLLAVIASSLVLIKSAYDTRRLFAAIHKAEVEALRLAGESKRLEAERQAQATSLRVERTARERLAMRTATPAVTLYVVDPAARLAAVPASMATSGVAR